MSRYAGRRFAGLLLSMAALVGGYLVGPTEVFSVYAQTLGVLYGAYLAGQSATDWKHVK